MSAELAADPGYAAWTAGLDAELRAELEALLTGAEPTPKQEAEDDLRRDLDREAAAE